MLEREARGAGLVALLTIVRRRPPPSRHATYHHSFRPALSADLLAKWADIATTFGITGDPAEAAQSLEAHTC